MPAGSAFSQLQNSAQFLSYIFCEQYCIEFDGHFATFFDLLELGGLCYKQTLHHPTKLESFLDQILLLAFGKVTIPQIFENRRHFQLHEEKYLICKLWLQMAITF